jgi:hypothetical protein
MRFRRRNEFAKHRLTHQVWRQQALRQDEVVEAKQFWAFASSFKVSAPVLTVSAIWPP